MIVNRCNISNINCLSQHSNGGKVIIALTDRKIIAFQADPLEILKNETDSSLLLAAEFEQRGYHIFFYQVKDLHIWNNNPVADGRFVLLKREKNQCNYTISRQAKKLDLSQVSAIMVRQDPPFNMEYITATYILELLKHKVLITNDLCAIRNYPEKFSPLLFHEFLPTHLISANFETIEKFILKHSQVVLKPLYQHGGADIILVNAQNYEINLRSHLKRFGHILVQKFLTSVSQHGDKRIIFTEDKIVGYFQRLPKSGDFRANTAVGGNALKCELTSRELTICNYVGAFLKKNKIFFAGIDLIDEHLIEINITSPTGLALLNKLYHPNHESIIADVIERTLNCDI